MFSCCQVLAIHQFPKAWIHVHSMTEHRRLLITTHSWKYNKKRRICAEIWVRWNQFFINGHIEGLWGKESSSQGWRSNECMEAGQSGLTCGRGNHPLVKVIFSSLSDTFLIHMIPFGRQQWRANGGQDDLRVNGRAAGTFQPTSLTLRRMNNNINLLKATFVR